MDRFVNLPEIKYIEVNNFDLYKDGTFKWDFSDTFNLFLGINGLGKTTTLKLIAYGLVGFIDENDNKKNISKIEIKELQEIKEYGVNQKGYFKRYKNQIHSTVYLEFDIGGHSFKVKRDILKHKIIKLVIDESNISGDLDKLYSKYFEKYSGMTIDNFTNILYTLLIRFEEAPSLLFRPRTQHIALRTLIFQNHFHKDFIEAERKYRTTESKYRKAKYDLTEIKKEIESSKKELLNIKKELNSTHEIKDNKFYNIENDIKDLENKISDTDNEISHYNNTINRAISKKENLITEKEKLENKLNKLLEEIAQLQTNFYMSIYGDSEIYNLAINSLNLRNICVFCNNKVAESKKLKLQKSINHGNCPFCNSKVSNDIISNINLEELNKLNNKKKNILEAKRKIEYEISAINKDIYSLDSNLKKLFYEKNTLIKKHEDNCNLLIDQNYDVNKDLATQAIFINKEKNDLEAKIKMLKNNFIDKSKEIFGVEVDYEIFEQGYTCGGKNPGLEYDFYLAEKRYKNLRESSRKNIESLEQDIINKFQKYNILKNEFYLIQEESNKLEKNIDVRYNIFVPVEIQSENKRTDESQLSKSQQILLDYAFRLALVELYSEISGNKKVFIAFESSEGVLDIENLEEFAKMLKQYSENNMLLVISNFNNIGYLETLMDGFNENKSNKLLNFIDISSKKNINRKFYFDLWDPIINKGEN